MVNRSLELRRTQIPEPLRGAPPETAAKQTLSVLVPVYNEEATLGELLRRVLSVPLAGFDLEVLVIDDGSTDRSTQVARQWAAQDRRVHLLRLPRNRGKGAAVREGLLQASGHIILIQDADLEYDPRDYLRILEAFRDPSVHVVYGSRILGRTATRYWLFWLGGRIVTLATNLLFGTTLTDQPTCYKAFRRDVLRSLVLKAEGFDFCAELTAQLLSQGYRIREVPIHYFPRSLEEGKKIRPRDGLRAIWMTLKIWARKFPITKRQRLCRSRS
jgi:dolichol-phosphate mannosyltransferase